MVGKVHYSVPAAFNGDQEPTGVSLHADLDEAERLRRFLSQHNVGEDEELRRRVYRPLVRALQRAGVFGDCDETFEEVKTITCDDQDPRLRFLAKQNIRLREDREQLRAAVRSLSDENEELVEDNKRYVRRNVELREKNERLKAQWRTRKPF